jgi:mono/diheme cytochrome c family protein
VFAGVLPFALACAAAAEAPPSEDDVVAAGRRLYREGRDESGRAVSALVQGDVPVLGTQVTCESCHGRSGMGAIESGRIPSALAGPLLFAADAQRKRAAYSESTLALALRNGVDPAGRSLDPLMPRYRLGDRDVAALAAYLRQLGAAPSPGVGPTSVRLATVVAGDVTTNEERAVLDVLEPFVADRNRSGPQRLRGGHAPGQKKETFRQWSLDVWRLSGPPERWRAQMETRYHERPVFAVVSGLAAGSWQPIHEFCEAQEVVCLLPNADLAPVDDRSFYSLYFSRGLSLEAQILASELLASGRGADVLQLVVGGAPGPAGAAERLGRDLERGGGRARLLVVEDGPGTDALARAISGPSSAVVVWLPRGVVRRLEASAGTGVPPLLFSSTLLEADWDAVPGPLRGRSQLVHLFKLPGDPDPQLERFRAWAADRGVPRRHERLQAQTFFAGLAAAEGIKHIGRYPNREYLMDLLDHASNLATYLPLYPRPGFGPGQRVLTRGGYVVDLSGRRAPIWMVP